MTDHPVFPTNSARFIDATRATDGRPPAIIAAKALTTFSVSSDGETVLLGFADSNDKPCGLALPALCIKEMMLSLPEMMRQALQRKFRDSSLRLVYPVNAWTLEASTERGRFILTLRTADQFEIAFVLRGAELLNIASLATAAERAGVERSVNPN